MTPTRQLDVYNSGTNCQQQIYAGAGDAMLYLVAGGSGKAQLKCNTAGVFSIYSSYNTTPQQLKFYVRDTINSYTMNIDGTVSTYYNWSGPQFTSTSDTSLKDDQQPVSQEDIRQVFEGLRTKTFIRNDIPEEFENGTRRVGFVAQDLQAILPPSFQNLVQTVPNYRDSGKDILAIDYGALNCVLWEVVKGQEAKLQSLEARLAALETQ